MKRGNTWLWVVIAVVVIGGLVYFATQKQNNQVVNPTPTTTEKIAKEEEVMKKDITPSGVEDKMMREAIVNYTATGFDLQQTKVKVGTKVTWFNKSGHAGNVSSAVHPTHQVYPPLNLGNFEDGEKLSLVFDKPGTYAYHNHLNASQFGKVIVE